MGKKRFINNAVEILHKLEYEGRPHRLSSLDNERLKGDIAQQIYDLRTGAHLSQRALAKRLGTTASVISRLEDADYRSHSVSMLRRIATALGCRLEVWLVPKKVRWTAGMWPARRAARRNGARRGTVA